MQAIFATHLVLGQLYLLRLFIGVILALVVVQVHLFDVITGQIGSQKTLMPAQHALTF